MNVESNDPLDAAIDRAARQIVEHDPPQSMYAATITAIRDVHRSSGPWWRWPLLSVPAAVVLIVALVIWTRPDAPVVTVEVPAVRTQPEPPTQIEPQTPRAAVRSQTRRTQLPRRQPPSAESQTSELAAAISEVRVREIAMSDVPLTTIAVEPVGIDSIHISDISLKFQ